jgi:hypothetical protein
MRMIGVSSLEFSHDRELILRPDFDVALWSRDRRSSRVPTLDGEAVLIDAGASASDRDMAITLPFNTTETVYKVIRDIVDNLSTVLVTNDEGAYLAHPKSLNGSVFLLQLLSVRS